MKPTAHLRSFLIIAGSSLLAISYSHAASGDWTALVGGNWSTATSWSSNPTVPGTAAGDVIGITSNIGGNANVTINTTPRTVGILNIGDSDNSHAFTVNASGGGTLTFDNGGSGAQINEVGSIGDVISAPVTLADNLALSVGGSLNISGIIGETGSRSLVKNGTGSITLNNGNTFSGGFTLNSGTVVGINAGTYGGFGSGTLTVTGGAITASSSSVATINNALNWGGSILFNRAGGSSGTPTLTFTGALTLSNNLAITLGVSTTAGAAAFTNNISGSFGINVVSGGPSSGNLNAITLSGANNTFSGGLSLGSGSTRPMSLYINSATALGATAGTFTITGSQTITIDNTSAAAITLTNNNPLAINRDFTFAGTRDLNMGTGAVNLNGALPRTITTTAGTLTLGGVISNGGLTKAGAGTLVLTGTNIFANGTTVSGGTLMLGDGTANTGNLGGTASIAVGTGATLAVNRTGATTQFTDLNTRLITGAGSFLQAGSGTTTLGYANTYTGTTTISNGTLSINSIANLSTNSAIGAPTTAPTAVIMIGSAGNTGTLAYTGTGHSSNRQIRIGTNSTVPDVGDTGGATITANGASNAALTFSAANFNTQTDATTGVGADRVLTLQGTSTGANTISGIIQDNLVSGSGTGTAKVGVTKAQAGTWILAGSNTYTGATTVSAGTLYVTGALSSSAVTVQAAGTIGSNGVAGVLGNGLTIAAGGNLDLTGATLGSNSSGILGLSAGTLTLGNLTFQDLLGWDWANASVGTYELVDGAFTVIFGSTAFLDAGSAYDFGNGKKGYFTSGSLNAVIVAVPEPSSVLLGGLGLLFLLRRRRD